MNLPDIPYCQRCGRDITQWVPHQLCPECGGENISTPSNCDVEPIERCPHGEILADDVCGPCSQGRPNRLAVETARSTYRRRKMSGLYNALFGQGANADDLLKVIGMTPADVPRYRDCFWDGEHIVVHTRTGGGNRDDYESENDHLTTFPGYVRDEDDDYDCTYANFYYKPPTEAEAALKDVPAAATPAEKWQALFAAMKANSR